MTQQLRQGPFLLRSLCLLWLGTLCLSQGMVQPLRAQGRAVQATSDIPTDLQAATQELNRLMQANPTIDAPVSLLVRPFRSASCAGQGSPAPGTTPTCINSLDMPPALVQSYFVAYVFSLRAQSDPATDPELASAAIIDRTILLNTTKSFPQGKASVGATACLIGRELAAIQLNQPQQRQEKLEQIDSQLAARIRSVAGNARSTQGKKELNLFLMSPLLMALSKATTPSGLNPMSDTLYKSGQWRILQQHSPAVASALQPLGGVSEELALRTWRDIDGYIAFALQDRDTVLAKQRQQAQSEALPLLANAGIDPRSCASVFEPPPSAAELVGPVSLYESVVGRKSKPLRPLPQRYLPDQRKVVIYPGGLPHSRQLRRTPVPGSSHSPQGNPGATGGGGDSQRCDRALSRVAFAPVRTTPKGSGEPSTPAS